MSRLSQDFADRVQALIAAPKNRLPHPTLDETTAASLPAPLAEHYRRSDLFGKPLPHLMWAQYRDATLLQAPGRALRVTYTHVNSAARPIRVAHIDSRLFGVPFCGLDVLDFGEQSMTGVAAGRFRVLHSTNPALRHGNLHSLLAEALIFPTVALAPWVRLRPADAHRVHVSLDPEYPGVDGEDISGTFTVSPDGSRAHYTTEARALVTEDAVRFVPWTAALDYAGDGAARRPTRFTATWHETGGDVTYFTSDRIDTRYR